MAKRRYLWVVETNEDGQWSPADVFYDWTRKQARIECAELKRMFPSRTFRVRPWVRYSAEDQ